MARRKRHEEHENHEAWAIPYGDLVTLLLAFFVVMYAMSSVNEGKYRVLSNSLTDAFNGTHHGAADSDAEQPSTPAAEQLPSTQIANLMAAGLPSYRLMPLQGERGTTLHGQTFPSSSDPRDSQHQAAPGSVASITVPTALPPGPAVTPPPGVATTAASDRAELNQVADDVGVAMSGLIKSGEVHIRRFDDWVAVDISTDILFGSGVAQLSPAAVSALQHLADSLKGWPNAVRVEGHTDNRPINTATFRSNWELSAARAASVVHLFMDRGVAPDRLAVVGFGEFRPAAANNSAAGRNTNRRVQIDILGRGVPEGRL